MTQLSPQIQTESFQSGPFPGAAAYFPYPGVLAGGGVQEAPEFAGRFAVLLEAARGTAIPGAETAFAYSENTSFSPAREADLSYGSRPPDIARPYSPEADPPSESVRVSREADSPPSDNRAGTGPEEAGAAPQEEDAETRPGSFAARGRGKAGEGAENAEAASVSASALTPAPAGEKQGREKAGVSGDGSEGIPGFGEGVPADAGPGMNADPVLAGAGAPDRAGGAAPADSRPARSERIANAGKTGGPGAADSSPAARAASREAAPEAAEALGAGASLEGAAGESGAGHDPAETAGSGRPAGSAGSAAEGRRLAQGAGLADAAAAAAGPGPGNAAAELAALPRQQKSLSPERPEKEGREEPGEARKGDRRRERFNLELRDFRTTPRIDGSIEGAAGTEKGDAENNGPPDHGQEQEIIVDLKSQARSQAEVSYNRESRGQISFRDTLARELHENLNNDIVRHASLVLKNGGEGLIRLSLRPEHLGNVKIRLEMSENKVVGKIVVESGEALRAFEQELRSLEQAFVDSGFEGASLEMSVASGGGQGGAEGQRENGEARPFFSERPAARSYDAASGASGDGADYWLSGADRQVNVLI
ncbi:MAG: flagellar hook-length control protein FliK [Treponema sp.]|nr:flagellar hook-length control protein FliK [Treponema sp.]